ncbi:MAG: endonuclease NucS domain-containing protein, partial [Candidatus Hodarchaeales archaeon]
MTTEIKVWQIVDSNLELIETTMIETGRRETEDLEKWIKSNPLILGQDISIIGEQVPTKSGSIDFLGIDKSGNLVIIELKRDKLPRDALAQAVDYASDVSSWDVDKISNVCTKYTDQG